MATDLKVSVRRQIDRLRKDLAVATGQVAALQAEIKRHEMVYDMLDGQKTAKRSRKLKGEGCAMTTRRRFSGEFSMGTRRVSQTAMQIKSAVW